MLSRSPAFDPAAWITEAWPARSAAEVVAGTELSWVRRTETSAAEALDRLEFDSRTQLIGELAGPRFRDRVVVAMDVRWSWLDRSPAAQDAPPMVLSRAGLLARILHPAYTGRRGRIVCTVEALLLPRPPAWGP